jgi:hypothetical protein
MRLPAEAITLMWLNDESNGGDPSAAERHLDGRVAGFPISSAAS